MRRIDCGVVGHAPMSDKTWRSVRLSVPWRAVVDLLEPRSVPRPAQIAALGELQVLEGRRNLIVSAPTNGGKSLVGYLVLLDAVRRGRRAVLVEPLRAVAREQAERLESVRSELAALLGTSLRVSICTGDYRLDHEMLTSPPPDQGDLIVATPERLDAILRNPDHDPWINSIGAVCVDEAHLLHSVHRGATLEYVLTTLLGLAPSPRIVLLSATITGVQQIQAWLTPCDVVTVKERYPPLQKEILALEPAEDANEMVLAEVQRLLQDEQASVLVFVYQTASTMALARLLMERLGPLCGPDGALAYHSQTSLAYRERVRNSIQTGRCRCVVSTTALGLGVNLPATHVILRDTTFPGVGSLQATEILQMVGRAGRGQNAGHAAVLLRSGDAWQATDLARVLRAEELELEPALHFRQLASTGAHKPDPADNTSVAKQVAALLIRHHEHGLSLDGIRSFFQRSLRGRELASRTSPALTWLQDPMRVLAYRDEAGNYRLSALGARATRAVLPLELASGFAQLLRDLLLIDSSERFLAAWRPLDHLIILGLLMERRVSIRRFSKSLVEQVDSWMEGKSGQTPVLFREWITGAQGGSKADELLGSLGVSPRNGKAPDDWARKSAYLAVLFAIVLFERGRGTPTEVLERRWQLSNLAGVEEKLRDELIWLLAGITRLLDIRCFYFHLREVCGANFDRIRGIKRLLRKMRRQAYELTELLKYCSPLGPVLLSIRRSRPPGQSGSVGVKTIRRLEAAGITRVSQLVQLGVEDLIQIGVRKAFAEQIHAYIRRRLQ
jgi:helicase